jgi:hypothetical protein
MGKIPGVDNMISTIITHPAPGQSMESNKTFNITIQTTHLKAGILSNPEASYYTAPQDLDDQGDIKGHCHVVVQEMGNMTARAPPDPKNPAFFQANAEVLNDDGRLQATVEGGLAPGIYRVCTIVSAENHQPVAMPVAARGSQDDCVRFTVKEKQ